MKDSSENDFKIEDIANYEFSDQNKNIINHSLSSIDNKELSSPIKLIDFTKKEFTLNPEALSILNSITDDIIIVSIVGKARTGKSYLMNLLLNSNTESTDKKTLNTNIILLISIIIAFLLFVILIVLILIKKFKK